MSHQNQTLAAALMLAVVLLGPVEFVTAQKTGAPKRESATRTSAKSGVQKQKVVTATSPKKESDVPDHVVIYRESPRLIDPKVYQIPLQLEAVRTVQLVALTDGIVREVHLKSGQKVDTQTEVVRLENREQQFLVDRAKANYKVAQIELKRAQSHKDADLVELAQAKLQAAKIDLDLATFRLERNSIRVPFAGEVFRVNVLQGQFVRAGEPLVEFGDASKLKVEIPVDRKQAARGKMIEIRIEETATQAKIEEILPLAPRFEPLRDLINSAASAVVHIDNAKGRFKVGQAVFAPLIPRHMIAEVPTASLENTPEGRRKLQVVRKNVIRDIQVQLHGQVGGDRIFVSGAFAPGDEVIVNIENPNDHSSHDLPDGTLIRLSNVAAAQSSSEEKEKRGRTQKGRANF